MRGAVFSRSREFREAARIAANSGMLSEAVLETANSVDGPTIDLKDGAETVPAKQTAKFSAVGGADR
jgi:methyl-accepting chemotaxis protein